MPLYNPFKTAHMGSHVNLSASSISAILVSASYTPNIDSQIYYYDLSAHEVNTQGATGYFQGGLTLSAGKIIAQDDTNDRAYLDANDLSWGSATLTARYIVLKFGAHNAFTPTDRLIGYIDMGSNQTATNGTFTIQWNANGILAFS